MAISYMTGYSGSTKTRAELLAWPQFQKLDDETARRALALVDASHVAGRPVGFGGIFRTYDQQLSLFLSRHHLVNTDIGCCSWNGHYYQLNNGMAHAAPPGRSYHEATTLKGECYAIDFTGDMVWLGANVAKYGLVVIQPEPWHVQPAELPHARRGYSSLYEPLKQFKLPGNPPVAPKKIYAPKATLKLNYPSNATETRNLQLACNFWKWRDAYGKELLVDGIFGAKTAQSVMSMQRALKITVDGVYGPATQAKLQAFLDVMVSLQP